MKNQFIGDVVTRWPSDRPREMEVLEKVEFYDSKGVSWVAEPGEMIDGASIPRLFWIWGSPFIGLYRRASVIHDVYCKSKSRPHKDVHRVFYEMCRADGVSRLKAKLMYNAIKIGGPKWQS